ncbi:MAG: hypothetical protein ABW022_07205 [Actinoplanes sp.]
MTAPDAVLLHTGTAVPEPTLTVTLLNLRQVKAWPDGLIVLHELRQLALDPTYRPYADTVERLTKVGLVERGCLLADVRDVVLAAIGDDGFTLRDPRAEP